MIVGLEGPISDTKGASQKVWLVTFRGQPTTVFVRSTSMFLRWPIVVVGYIEQDTAQHNETFPLSKKILCKDGKYIEGKVSYAARIDIDDDDPEKHSKPKKGGEKLNQFATAHGHEGIKQNLDEIITLTIEKNFARHNKRDVLERHNSEISQEVHRLITTGNFVSHRRDESIVNALSYGIKFDKFEVILEAPEPMRKSRIDAEVEEPERLKELTETETINKQIDERIEIYRKNSPKDKIPSVAEIRAEILQERALAAGKYEQFETKGRGGIVFKQDND
jgi:hypothetical protein